MSKEISELSLSKLEWYNQNRIILANLTKQELYSLCVDALHTAYTSKMREIKSQQDILKELKQVENILRET